MQMLRPYRIFAITGKMSNEFYKTGLKICRKKYEELRKLLRFNLIYWHPPEVMD